MNGQYLFESSSRLPESNTASLTQQSYQSDCKNANFNCARGWVGVARYYDRNLFARWLCGLSACGAGRDLHTARTLPARTSSHTVLGRETTANYE